VICVDVPATSINLALAEETQLYLHISGIANA
jgi:hypothetical protein